MTTGTIVFVNYGGPDRVNTVVVENTETREVSDVVTQRRSSLWVEVIGVRTLVSRYGHCEVFPYRFLYFFGLGRFILVLFLHF